MRLAVLLAVITAAGVAAEPTALETALRTGGDRPADLSFQLRIPGDRNVFYPGEPIPAEMVFQATAKGIYRTTKWSSGPYRDWGAERFESVPSLEASPAAPYFPPAAQFINGAVGVVSISPEETAIPLRLRDHLRLDKPGTYRIRVATNRVVRFDPEREGSDARSFVTLVSDPVTITIREPDAAWESSQLGEILADIDDLRQQAASYSPELFEALGRLSYLTSPEAADAMVQQIGRLGPAEGRILLHGLAASAHRERIYQALEAGVQAPEQPVSGASITALAALQAFHRFGPEGFRPEDDAGRYDREINRLRDAIDRRLLAALPNKSPSARALCLKTLLEERGGRPDWDALRPLSIASLPDLPLSDLHRILNNRWETIQAPSVRAFLLELAEGDDQWYAAQYGAALPDSPIFRQVRETAIRRLSDVAPADARRVVIAEAQRLQSPVEYHALLELPDALLPELDPILLEQLRAPELGFDRTRALALLERYGTEQVYEEIRKLEGKWFAQPDCDVPSSLLAYYVRVDPEYGLDRLGQAVQSGPDYCRMNVLEQVAQLEAHSKMEEFAAGLLYDASPIVVSQAAMWLSTRGSPGGEELLWTRLEAFHAEWKGREDELRAFNRTHDHSSNPNGIELGLAAALLNIESARAQVGRLKALCLTKACLEQTGAW